MAKGPQYPLARDYAELVRLDYQHAHLKDMIGGCLHPSILPADKANLKIVDVGTGSG